MMKIVTDKLTFTVPDLDHDAKMLAKFQHKVSANGRLERRLVAALCAHLVARGWTPAKVFDGEVETPVTDAKSSMELIFNLDEVRLYFERGTVRAWVYLVLGNGTDIVSDYLMPGGEKGPFAVAMAAFDPEEYA